jgi:hypothetical protein
MEYWNDGKGKNLIFPYTHYSITPIFQPENKTARLHASMMLLR